MIFKVDNRVNNSHWYTNYNKILLLLCNSSIKFQLITPFSFLKILYVARAFLANFKLWQASGM